MIRRKGDDRDAARATRGVGLPAEARSTRMSSSRENADGPENVGAARFAAQLLSPPSDGSSRTTQDDVLSAIAC